MVAPVVTATLRTHRDGPALVGKNQTMADDTEAGSDADGPTVPLQIDLDERDGHAIVIAVGRLDWNTAAGFDQRMRELSSRYDGAQITLDLTQIEFIDLDGVDAVIRAGYRAKSSGPMTLRPPAVRRYMLDVDAIATSYEIDLTSEG